VSRASTPTPRCRPAPAEAGATLPRQRGSPQQRGIAPLHDPIVRFEPANIGRPWINPWSRQALQDRPEGRPTGVTTSGQIRPPKPPIPGRSQAGLPRQAVDRSEVRCSTRSCGPEPKLRTRPPRTMMAASREDHPPDPPRRAGQAASVPAPRGRIPTIRSASRRCSTDESVVPSPRCRWKSTRSFPGLSSPSRPLRDR
jgi:hypothetical protein